MLDFIAIQTLNGMVYSMLLFQLALGLSLTFGMLRVVNLAHGSFFLLGAYLGYSVWLVSQSFWLAAAAAVIGAGRRTLLETLSLKRFYVRSDLDQVILTFGIALAAADVMKAVWGRDIHSIPAPAPLAGAVQIAGIAFPVYRLLLIVVGVALFIFTWLAIEKTRIGALVRAAVADHDMVAGLGFDVRLMFTAVFAFGCALAGLAGILARRLPASIPVSISKSSSPR